MSFKMEDLVGYILGESTLSLTASGIALAVVLFFAYVGVGGLIETASFPKPPIVEYNSAMPEDQKCKELLGALTHQLKYEIEDSKFGWTANAIFVNRWLLDNRVNRQIGVINAYQELFSIFSIDMATLGHGDEENKSLKTARLDYFNGGAERIFQIPGFTSKCRSGFALIDKYTADVARHKATYNIKSDDIYSAITTISGPKVLGKAVSLLSDCHSLPFYELDNRIYQAQGVAIVARDFLNAIYTLYPQFCDKNNEENMRVAMQYLNRVASYNPLYITAWFNHGEHVVSDLMFAIERINGIANSIKI